MVRSVRPTTTLTLSWTRSGKQKPPPGCPGGVFQNYPAITYSRAKGHYHRPWMLNGRVRNGNGCDQPGMVTGKLLRLSVVRCQSSVVKGQVNDYGVNDYGKRV